MPQEFNVLKCYKCDTFQVHQVKKSKKWNCKLCGLMQTIKRTYGVGNGKDCRLHVQKLNSLRLSENICQNSEPNTDYGGRFQVHPPTITTEDDVNTIQSECSKWFQFIDEKKIELKDVIEDNSTDLSSVQDAGVVMEIPKRLKKRRKINSFDDISQPKYETIGHSNHTVMQSELSYPEVDISLGKENLASIRPSSLIRSCSCITQKAIIKSETQHKLNKNIVQVSSLFNSKWSKFVDEPDDENEIEQTSVEHITQARVQDKVSEFNNRCGIEQEQDIHFETHLHKSVYAIDALFSFTNDEALDDILNI